MTNEIDWTEAQTGTKPLVADDATERANVVENFMAGKPTYGPDSKAAPQAPQRDPLDMGSMWNDSEGYVGATIEKIASLAALKADPTHGDAGTGSPFKGGTNTDAAWTAGRYITLADGSKAHWDGSAWQAGAV
jgi:hypothetical protein